MAETSQAAFEAERKRRAAAKIEAENARKKAIADKAKTDKVSGLRRKINQNLYNIESEKKDITRYTNLYLAYAKSHPEPRNPGDNAVLDSYEKSIDKAKSNIVKFTNEINSYTTDINKTLGLPQLPPGAGLHKPPAPNPNDNQAPKPKFQFSEKYTYNAPMVKENYFSNGGGIINTVLDGQFVDQGKYDDARQAWQGTTGGRGTLQMDQRFLSSFSSEALQAKNFDLNKYGFKFLYNPQTVSMSWGLLQEMDPYYEATGADKFQVVSTALLASTVSFELMLNRIKDFDYINENGILPGLKNPYPEIVTNDEAKVIYKKGTMYDLEYLLRVVNGPNADFKSDLSGMMTADRAWLKPAIMELHLGDSLRYRVRISEFSVNHVIFTPKMVPILSTVRLSFNRFADGDVVGKGAGTTRDDVGTFGNGSPSVTLPSGSTVYTGPRGRRG